MSIGYVVQTVMRGDYTIDQCLESLSQREGLGILEYQAMPSLRDIDQDGWLCSLLYNKHQMEIPSARSWAAPIRASRRVVRKRQAVRPVHNVQNHTYRVTLFQPARRAAVLDQPSKPSASLVHLTQIPRR